jgi:hypothetical protein
MKNIENILLPDDVYDWIARRAAVSGGSPAEEVVEVVKRDAATEGREAALIEAVKRGHEEQATMGIYLTTEDILSAVEWGRE